MQRIIKFLFITSTSLCLFGIVTILLTYAFTKPNLPEIKLVDESELQMPLKVFTKDGVLIGEFGEIKRRSIKYNQIPDSIKEAFLAAEDDNFFNHQGISYSGLVRSFLRCISSSGCRGGGGTITMQVVRGYLLSRDQTIQRKISEIFLALELEGKADKEKILELYVNRIFLGNRSYGIEAASNTYFNKSVDNLTISESATIAALAQLPSKVNPVKNPRRTIQRRNWILGRMLLLNYITDEEYQNAISEKIQVTKNIDLYAIDGAHIAELARQEVIKRYGLKAYKEGWSVFTTIDSESQRIAKENILKHLFEYDKRHGWQQAKNYAEVFNEEQKKLLNDLQVSFLKQEYFQSDDFFKDTIQNKLNNIYDLNPFYKSHKRAIVIKVTDENIYLLDEDFDVKEISWSNEYDWARKRISIDSLDIKPNGFGDFINFGDFVYFKKIEDFFILDQIPNAESSLISIDPNSGRVVSYIGGKNFNESSFDRVRLSYPQSGSSFKPFIYSAGLANGYNLSSLINDAPIIFQDENLESEWKPKNYTGKFYGPISLREALTKSVNIVSVKLLRELGIEKSHEYLENFGFNKSRLPTDLSLALGSGNFSPAEMVRAYGVIASNGILSDLFFIDRIVDRKGKIIFSHQESINQSNISNYAAFPWLDTIEMNINKPYYILNPLHKEEKVIDERISFLMEDTLKGFMKNGIAGRKSAFLERDDIGGKTGTTNDSISTWFSGFHKDLVTTVWVGTDDFSSLGKNEFGSTIALPIWLDYMDFKLRTLDKGSFVMPDDISFVRINKSTGKADSELKENFYFELFLNENLE